MITITDNNEITLKHVSGEWSGQPARLVAIMNDVYKLSDVEGRGNLEAILFERVKNVFAAMKVEFTGESATELKGMVD